MALNTLTTGATALLHTAQTALHSVVGSEPNHGRSIQKEIRVKKLFVHPIKSCRGSSVQEAHYDESGLRFDRTWLIIDANTRRFFTARDLPKMVTITPHMDLANNILRIEIPLTEKGKGTITVETPLEPSEEQMNSYELVEDVTIWVHKVNGYAVSKEADAALSEFFGKPVRLIRKGPARRPAGPIKPEGPTEWSEDSVRYQDFYSILIASTASLTHVQQTLRASVYPSLRDSPSVSAEKEAPNVDSDGGAWGAKVQDKIESYKVPDSVKREYWTPEHLENLEIERFRPNLVVESAGNGERLDPFEEDGWETIELFDGREAAGNGQAPGFGPSAEGKGSGVYCLARCARCMVPNIDPATGIRDGLLPYRVLQAYRKVDPGVGETGKPCFGMLSVPREKAGTIRVGDIVRVTKTTNPASRVLRMMS